MKNLGFILVSAVTIPILLLVGLYLLWPQQPQPQPPLVISVDNELAPLETDLARREATVQAQLDGATAALRQQQAKADEQTNAWLKNVAETQRRLDELQQQSQALQLQIARLEITRTTRLTDYQTELEQTRRQYETRLAELENQLKDTRARLDQVNAQLQQ